HNPEAALDYARRLADVREQYKDTLEIVMRVYSEKPRTADGWKLAQREIRIHQNVLLAKNLSIFF
ncbi:MAG: 3-deoxy-7-phosphoheptulonate synthase, partial [Ottowia sp.]|nr:3-deoxy-7-phosphoheptulonate synthase [Ottowia sp.]